MGDVRSDATASAATAALPVHAPLCVNVSRDEFSAPRFAEWVIDLLARFSLPASQLELDISEAHLIGELDTSQLHALHRLGVSITLDDLGMGGLSLKHLFELPISSAKLDLRFLPGFIKASLRCLSVAPHTP